MDRRDGRVRSLGGQPLVRGSVAGLLGLNLESRAFEGLDATEALALRHTLILQLNGPVEIQHQFAGQAVREQVPGGRITVVPAGGQLGLGCTGPVQLAGLSFDPACFQLVSGGQFDPGRFELRPQFAIEDKVLEVLILRLLRELEAGRTSSQIYIEALAANIVLHLAVQHSVPKTELTGSVGSKPVPFLVRKAVVFMNERICREISSRELAEHVGQSPFHFGRTFKEATGYSPHQYLLRQRIERAKQIMLRGEKSLAEVAGEVGFCDQSHLSRHFKRVTGLTPGEFTQQMCGWPRFTSATETASAHASAN